MIVRGFRRVLADVPTSAPATETPNARLIARRTDAARVGLAARLRATYPREMSLMLQYQYRDLVVTPQAISVTVSFNGVWEAIVIPLEAMTAFEDQTASFRIGFRDVEQRQ